jgi:hypothetical protein
MFNTLNVYVQHWEFSGIAFRTLRRILSSGNVTRLVLLSAFMIAAIFIYIHQLRNTRLSTDMKYKDVISTFYLVSLSFLLCTPTLHPWYVLYLVCFLPFTLRPAGLALSWSIFFGYYVIIPYFFLGKWVENDYVPVLIWLAPSSIHLVLKYIKKGRL